MNDTPAPTPESPSDAAPSADAAGERIFLVVVDESPEFGAALRFAARRAKHTGGRVALLFVVERGEFEHWMAVGELIREEARQQAEQVLHRHAAMCKEISGKMPILHIREGRPRDELLALLDEEPQISVLVLGANTGGKGPGPLVSYLVGKVSGKLRVPITVVPGGLSDEQIDALT
ncbi:MAG: universal stress protein [Alphaproteobacteria bacterium]